MTTRWARIVLAVLPLAVATPTGSVARAQQLGPKSVRELLDLHGIDASQLDRLQDGQPLGADDEETLIRILQRFPRFPRLALLHWSQEEKPTWTEIAATPHERRSHVFRVQGRVTRVERSPLLPEVARRLEFSEYYRVSLRLADSSVTAVVCTRIVPRSWLATNPSGESVAAIGILMKAASQQGDHAELVFAAERVEWYPDQTNAALAVSPAQVFLAQQGFDLGLLADARDENKKPLTLRDRECFYQLLGAVARTDRQKFVTQPHQPLDVVNLLREPREFQGEILTLDGIARRAVRVRIDEPDDRERFGLDHYFQIDLFIDLNKQVIKLKTLQDRKDAPVFADSFPVTVCVPTLPPGLPESDILRENVRIHGVFFKLWTYSSDYVSSFDKKLLQVSPMLIGAEPSLIRPDQFVPGFGSGLAVLAVLSLLGLWWSLRRPPASAVTRTGRTAFARSIDSNSIGGEQTPLPDKPDFSNLE